MKRRRFGAVLASAAVVSLAGQALAQSAADRAVEEAKQYSGITLNVLYEAGLQPLDPKTFTGPMWEELTGIRVNVIEVPVDQIFTRIMQEHRGRTGAYDVLNVIPNQMPDLALAGALEPLDDFMERYGFTDEVDAILPVYRDNWMTVEGTTYGLPDDGDVLVLYYRTDVFGDEALQAAYRERFGEELRVPESWEEFGQVGAFITEMKAPEMYGGSYIHAPGNAQYMFQERYRTAGGRFFDPETMRAQVNGEIGRQVLEQMRAEGEWMPPGVQQWGFVEVLQSLLSGESAMAISWPPVGRWAAGYGRDSEALAWLPESRVAGLIGYAPTPGGHPELAVGFSLSVASGSRNKEAAYLFVQWMNSEEISLQRVMLPYALRDPFRESHFTSEEYMALWPEAPEYLETLKRGAETGLLDLSLIQTDRYEEGIRQALSRLWGGEDAQAILDDLAAQWDQLTDRIGVENQKRVYADWSSKPNAYPAN